MSRNGGDRKCSLTLVFERVVAAPSRDRHTEVPGEVRTFDQMWRKGAQGHDRGVPVSDGRGRPRESAVSALREEAKM